MIGIATWVAAGCLLLVLCYWVASLWRKVPAAAGPGPGGGKSNGPEDAEPQEPSPCPRSNGRAGSKIRDELLHSHQALISVIVKAFQSWPQALQVLTKSVERLASEVMFCRASRNYHHIKPGGLFTHSIEVAAYVAQRGRSRFKGDPRAAEMSLLAVICALFHDVGKKDQHFIRCEACGVGPGRETLESFYNRHELTRVKADWTPGPLEDHDRASRGFIVYWLKYLKGIVSEDLLQTLYEHLVGLCQADMKKIDLLVFDGDKESGELYRAQAHEERIYPLVHADPAPATFLIEPSYHVLVGCTLNLMHRRGELRANRYGAHVYVRDDWIAIDIARHGMEIIQWLKDVYRAQVPTLGCRYVTPWWVANKLDAEEALLKTESEKLYHAATVEYPREVFHETEILLIRRKVGPITFLQDVIDFAGRIEFRTSRNGKPENFKVFLRNRDAIPREGSG